VKSAQDDADEGEWKFGDVWKEGSPDQKSSDEEGEFVEVLRTDTGRGYDDSTMLDLVSYLGSRGVHATYDSFSLGLEPAAIKTYVLKVELGKAEEALEYLREKLGEQDEPE
jgi:hypothetical protein